VILDHWFIIQAKYFTIEKPTFAFHSGSSLLGGVLAFKWPWCIKIHPKSLKYSSIGKIVFVNGNAWPFA
jgi:hypothetical protein